MSGIRWRLRINDAGSSPNRPLNRYVILRVAHASGMPGTLPPPTRVTDPDMHHDTCVTHVPWCTPGSLTSGSLQSPWRWNVPGIPGAWATDKFTYLVRGPLPTQITPHISHLAHTIYEFAKSNTKTLLGCSPGFIEHTLFYSSPTLLMNEWTEKVKTHYTTHFVIYISF